MASQCLVVVVHPVWHRVSLQHVLVIQAAVQLPRYTCLPCNQASSCLVPVRCCAAVNFLANMPPLCLGNSHKASLSFLLLPTCNPHSSPCCHPHPAFHATTFTPFNPFPGCHHSPPCACVPPSSHSSVTSSAPLSFHLLLPLYITCTGKTRKTMKPVQERWQSLPPHPRLSLPHPGISTPALMNLLPISQSSLRKGQPSPYPQAPSFFLFGCHQVHGHHISVHQTGNHQQVVSYEYGK